MHDNKTPNLPAVMTKVKKQEDLSGLLLSHNAALHLLEDSCLFYHCPLVVKGCSSFLSFSKFKDPEIYR